MLSSSPQPLPWLTRGRTLLCRCPLDQKDRSTYITSTVSIGGYSKIPLKPRQPRRQSPNSACAIFGLRPRLSAPTILQTHLNLQTTNGACVSAPVTGDPHSLFAKQTIVVTTERLWEKCTQQSAPKPLQASPVQTMRS